MKCALCGFEFTESEAKRPCARCPLGAHCDLFVVPTVAIKPRKSPNGSGAGARGGDAATALLRGR
jgi:hypothetical protein